MQEYYRTKGFTLVELLAVIVILGIILAIAIPGITGLIESARRNAFEDNVKLLIKSINTKVNVDDNYDVYELSTDTMEGDFGVSSENYESLAASYSGGNIYIDVVGQNKWDGLSASGTLSNLIIGNGQVIYTLAPESCFTFNNGTGTITHYDLYNPLCPTSLRIPDTIDGVNVKHIAPGAFVDADTQLCGLRDDKQSWSGVAVPLDYVHYEGDGYDICEFQTGWHLSNPGPITGVRFPFYLETIGYEAFKWNQISNVIFLNNITEIGDHAFKGNNLTNVTIPDSVTYLSGFDRNNLTSVSIPQNVTVLGENAFGYNILSNVTIPSNVSIIDDRAFVDNQLVNITIPNGVTVIGEDAFSINQLVSISIPTTVTNIGISAFNGNQLQDDQSFIYARNGDGSVDNTVLVSYGGAQRNNVVIPSTVTTVGDYAFDMLGMNNITIPNGVTTIGAFAFHANSLNSITIPNSVIIIGDQSFGINNLTDVVIPNSVTTIGFAAFTGNDINNLTLSTNTTSIGAMAFYDNNLTNVTIPNDVTAIGEASFYKNSTSNSNLTNIINKTGRVFDWGRIVNWSSGFNFATGMIVNPTGNVVVSSN